MAVRDLAKEFSWRRTMQRHARSGKSVRAFCQAEGVSEPSFHYWRQVLRARDQSAAISTKNGELLDKHAPEAPSRHVGSPELDDQRPIGTPLFMPLRIAVDGLADPRTDLLEVALVSGAVLKIPAGFDRETLRGVIAMLEPTRC